MRGGTSHGPFFKVSDLPADLATRDRVLLAGFGSGLTWGATVIRW